MGCDRPRVADDLASAERQLRRDAGGDRATLRLRCARAWSNMTVEQSVVRVSPGDPYQSFEQEHATAEFGMWIFLATEVMLFGGLFTAYTVYRTVYPAGFAEGSRHLDLLYGAPNTAVLLVSSLTMALGVRAA